MTDTLDNYEFAPRTKMELNSRNIASMGDVRSLHNVVDDEFTGEGITVVVMDSGIDDSHPVFDDGDVVEKVDIVGGGPGDEVGHGTACAGLIKQLAPDVEFISLRIFGNSGKTSGRTIFDAYKWLNNNADRIDLVNMSWGAQKKVRQIDQKHNELVRQGVHTVVAAGNTGERGGSPATAESAFSVGAVDEHGNLTNFSSYNPNYDNPDVAAIGKNNRLARADGTSMGDVINENWTKASGTSFAAPIVSGFVAQVLEKNRGANVVKGFEDTARNIPQTKEEGAGIADYAAVMSRVGSAPEKPDTPDQPDEQPEEPSHPTVEASSWSFAGNDAVYIDADWLPNDVTLKATKINDDPLEIRFENTK